MTEAPKKQPRCDYDQYALLLMCSEEKDIEAWNQWRKQYKYEEILLEGVNFYGGYLEGAELNGANLKSVMFYEANLKGAKLIKANLEGASFILSHVDGDTFLSNCYFDKKTNFNGVGLNSATVEPRLKEALQNNIRRIQWRHWYNEGPKWQKYLKSLVVQPFWYVTDYGSSTLSIVKWFFIMAFLFAAIYLFWPFNGSDGMIHQLYVPENPWYETLVRACYFSIVTMTTLGFGDMHALATCAWGHIVLTIQVLLGYVMLGALITRLGIMFFGSGPALKPTKPGKKRTK